MNKILIIMIMAVAKAIAESKVAHIEAAASTIKFLTDYAVLLSGNGKLLDKREEIENQRKQVDELLELKESYNKIVDELNDDLEQVIQEINSKESYLQKLNDKITILSGDDFEHFEEEDDDEMEVEFEADAKYEYN